MNDQNNKTISSESFRFRNDFGNFHIFFTKKQTKTKKDFNNTTTIEILTFHNRPTFKKKEEKKKKPKWKEIAQEENKNHMEFRKEPVYRATEFQHWGQTSWLVLFLVATA